MMTLRDFENKVLANIKNMGFVFTHYSLFTAMDDFGQGTDSKSLYLYRFSNITEDTVITMKESDKKDSILLDFGNPNFKLYAMLKTI